MEKVYQDHDIVDYIKFKDITNEIRNNTRQLFEMNKILLLNQILTGFGITLIVKVKVTIRLMIYLIPMILV